MSLYFLPFFTVGFFLSSFFIGIASRLPESAFESVQYTLCNNARYSPGKFTHEKDGDSLFTLPQTPKEAAQQSVLICKDTQKPLPYESVLMRVQQGDGRKRVDQPTRWPYPFHGQLNLKFDDGDYGGTGFMVGPHHLLTAGHNVYNPKKSKWVKEIKVRLALSNDAAPFGEVKGTIVHTFKEWVSKGSTAFDMGLVILESSIGLQTGWMGLLSLNERSLLQEKVQVTGYPADKSFKEMWEMQHVVKRMKPEEIFYDIDTYGGQSGSAVWINKWGSPYAVGVHTYGEGVLYSGNSGCRISAAKLKIITDQWIAGSYQKVADKPMFLAKALSNLGLASSSSSSSVEEDYAQGQRARVAGDLSKAFGLYKKAADKGYKEAQYHLGRCYHSGQGVSKNIEEAIKSYTKAAKQGMGFAQVSLGNIYFSICHGEETDYYDPNAGDNAVEWYKKAAEQGLKEGEYGLGRIYLERSKGRIGPPDFIFSKLGDRFNLREEDRKQHEKVMERDFEEGLKYVTKAAEHGLLDAQHYLAEISYLNIDFINHFKHFKPNEHPTAEAIKWFKIAADRGHAEAQYRLGSLYHCGDVDGTKNVAEAIKWYRKAAAQGHEEAQEEMENYK